MRALLRSLAHRSVGGVELRPYTAADFAALYALDRACFPPGIAYGRAELRAFLQHPSSFTVLACRGRIIEGFAVVRPARKAAAGAALHVITIDVAPTARRKGVGGALMHWIAGKAEELGSEAIMLEVAVDNLPAQLFYRHHGFAVVGTIPGYYNGVLDALQMERSTPAAPAAS